MEGIISRHYTDCLSRLIFLQSTPQQKFHFARPCVLSEAQREAIPPFHSLFITEIVKWVMHVAPKDFHPEACSLLLLLYCSYLDVVVQAPDFYYKIHSQSYGSLHSENNKPSYFKG